MIQYFMLIGIPYIASFFSIKENKHCLVFSNSKSTKNNNLTLITFFILLAIILMLRDEVVGRDLLNYKYIFKVCSKSSFVGLKDYQIEPVYKYVNWLIGKITNNYQIFIGIIALFTIIPIANVYCKDKQYGYLKVIIFVNMSTFVMLFSGIRQSMAMALGMCAYCLVKKNAIVSYLLVCVVAIGIHTSAFMLLFMYPLYYLNLKKKHLLLVFPVIAVVFALKRPIFAFLGNLLEAMTDYTASLTVSNAYGILLLFLTFLIFSYIVIDEKKATREIIAHRNFLILCIIVQCFASVNSLAMRMGYYYILFVPLVVADTLKYKKQKYAQIVKVAEIFLNVFFTIIFVWGIYRSYITGVSDLDIVPYQFFWEE